MARAQTFDSFGWQGRDRRLALADTIVVVRDGKAVDLLDQASQLVRWLDAEKGWLGTCSPGDAPELSEVHRLRDAIRALLFAAADGRALPASAAAVVNQFSAASPRYRRLDLSQPESPCAVYGDTGASRASQILAAIADAAIDLLAGPDRDRIQVCSAPSCGMFFLAGKRGRQWCSVSCGNRARVARHHKRTSSKPAR